MPFLLNNFEALARHVCFGQNTFATFGDGERIHEFKRDFLFKTAMEF
jgi:hypothetical protein